MPLIDHRALLLWNIFTDLILNSLTLPVIDNLTLSHGIGGALLLSHRFTFGFIPGGAGLGSLGGARFLMESFLDGSGDVNTLQFLRVVTLFFLLGRTLLTDVISCGAVPLDLKRTFSSLNLLLNWTLGDSTGSLLDIGTGLVRNISALLPGHRLVGGLGNLVADFLGHLTTHWLRWSRSLLAGIELVGDVGESQEKRYNNEELHLGRYFLPR